MISLQVQYALEREVVGQPRAIHTLVRAATTALSGLDNPEAPLGIYLFLGPSGTGKTHTARSVARALHGGSAGLAAVDCKQMGSRNEWPALARQVAPHFRFPCADQEEAVVSMAPHSVLLIEHLEASNPEFVQALIAVLETGYLMLPDGKCGSLSRCLVLVTSSLCAREIYGEDRHVGFSPAADDLEESEKARIYQLCCTAVEKKWGSDLLGHLDDLIVFHRLRERHLPFILRRLAVDLNRKLSARRISCELDRGAAAFLTERASGFLHLGAWFLVKVFRRFVLFPVADLVASGRVSPGSKIRVKTDSDDRLRFEVGAASKCRNSWQADRASNIAIEWDETPAC